MQRRDSADIFDTLVLSCSALCDCLQRSFGPRGTLLSVMYDWYTHAALPTELSYSVGSMHNISPPGRHADVLTPESRSISPVPHRTRQLGGDPRGADHRDRQRSYLVQTPGYRPRPHILPDHGFAGALQRLCPLASSPPLMPLRFHCQFPPHSHTPVLEMFAACSSSPGSSNP